MATVTWLAAHGAIAALLFAAPSIAGAARPVVVIDAGHGGRDSGAVGLDGTLEKDITLAIAGQVAADLTANGVVAVRMTRTSDRFASLDDRVKFARRHHAALFLSIHADSAPGTPARGWTLYSLSDAASTIAAARFARRENEALASEGASDSETASLLADIVQGATINASRMLADALGRCLAYSVGLHANGGRTAAFWVLKATEVPSLLLETGYLSSKSDLAYLKSEAGKAALAGAIATAISRLLGRGASSKRRKRHDGEDARCPTNVGVAVPG